MTNPDFLYAQLIADTINNGEEIRTRNSDVYRIFGETIKFDCTPLISLRKTAWKTALREWEWFMSGSNNINDLHSSVHPWWKPWADNSGFVKYNYSQQFRSFSGMKDGKIVLFDQIEHLIDGILNHPFSRRNIITTWNPYEMAQADCPITNCHNTVTQFFVDDRNKLDMVTNQRSVDVICGLPHNLIQYWAFLLWLSFRCNKTPGIVAWIGGDIHVYKEHEELALKILKAAHQNNIPPNNLIYTPTSNDFKADDFSLEQEYKPLITEKAKMIV